jgi:hypothetical protein
MFHNVQLTPHILLRSRYSRAIAIGLMLSALAGCGVAATAAPTAKLSGPNQRPWTITLCPRNTHTATQPQSIRNVKRVLAGRLKTYGLDGRISMDSHRCTIVHLSRGQSWARILTADLRRRGQFAIAEFVPATAFRDTGNVPQIGSGVRYVGDWRTARTKAWPEVRLLLSGHDIRANSVRITKVLPTGLGATFSFTSHGSNLWCRFTSSHVKDQSVNVVDRQILAVVGMESAIRYGAFPSEWKSARYHVR